MNRKAERIAILSSDSGTTLQMIINAVKSGDLNLNIEIVISDRDCSALKKAQDAGIDTWQIEDAKSVEELNERLYGVLMIYDPDLVVLAGYLNTINETILQNYTVIGQNYIPIFDEDTDEKIEERMQAIEKCQFVSALKPFTEGEINF